MIRTLFFAIIVLGSTVIASAQRPNGPKMDPEEMAKKTVSDLCKSVEVSTAIQDSLNVAFLNFFNQMDKARESGERPNFEKYEKERDSKVKSFLTDEQYALYTKFMDERKPKGQGAGRGEMGEGRPPMNQ